MRIKRFGVCIAALCAVAAVSAATETGDKEPFWLGMTLEQTEKALADHTRQTLRLLKDNGIDVKWVQVGNETTHGFLWPMGRFEENPVNYASLTKAGIKAVREVYPEA